VTVQAASALRSNLRPGTSPWATRRAQWRALGLSEEEMAQPKIAIVNSSSELAICFSHLDGIVPRLKEAIRAAGGTPFEVRTAAPSDFITSAGHGGRYILPTRDLIVNDIEVAVEGALLDGMVCLASCDKTTPGQLMAAGRLDIPTIVVPCGYQSGGRYCDAHIDIEDVFSNAGRVATGELSIDELKAMADAAISSPGVCAGLGTANSMHMAAEALGMAPPGSSPCRANGEKMWAAVDWAGRRIVELVEEGLRPSQVMTLGAFRNAVAVMLASSASVNSVKHLQAIADEAGCCVDIWAAFESLADEVPLLTDIRPNGERLIEELDAAGGCAALLKQLSPLLELDAMTVAGRLGEVLSGVEVADEEVVRSLDRPLGRDATILVIRGSLAPDGALTKRAVVDTRPMRFRGPAVIFHSREEAIAGLEAGAIHAGDVVVLRGLGPKGGPGMAFASGFIFALEASPLAGKVAVVTDSQLSGLVNKGLVVGEIAPEAAVGGPLGLVEPGDTITIDLDRRRVDLEVDEVVLATRRAELPPSEAPTRGWLSIYGRVVAGPHRGLSLADEPASSKPAR
jgi:dihydroxy-acid dehydratase